jgi:hypothetical protein
MKGTHQKYISGYFQQSGSNPIFNKNVVAWRENPEKKWAKCCFWKAKVVRGIHVFQYKNFALILKHFCRRNSLCLGVK